MIKLKEMLEENALMKIGIGDTIDMDSRKWRKAKYGIGDVLDGLIDIGEDYSVFQSAKHTARTLKKIRKLWSTLS
jgi:hypothetical protein